MSVGRSSGLGGLSPGSWYIVRVGEDESGAVVDRSEGVATDADTCYAVSGDTILSGEAATRTGGLTAPGGGRRSPG